MLSQPRKGVGPSEKRREVLFELDPTKDDTAMHQSKQNGTAHEASHDLHNQEAESEYNAGEVPGERHAKSSE